MKGKKLRDIVVSLFLITSLGISAFIVSCSDEVSNVITADHRSAYHQHVNGKEDDIINSAISTAFGQIGDGAFGDLGSVGMGWVLGSMGLAGSSGPNYIKQLHIIEADLDTIISILNDVDAEVHSIDSVLGVLKCALEENSLTNEIAAINTNYEIYNTFLLSASQGDTIPNSQLMSFANLVINGNGTQPSMATALSNIQVNINEQSGVIVACMQSISKPDIGTFGLDTNYYAQAQSLLSKYYYYQTIGLGLLSEAYHYNAWVDAGSPGEEYTNADSVQKVCSENSQSAIDCNFVVVVTNTTYNSLLEQFSFVGAPYTDANLIFQQSSNGGIAWVRSLEDFTQQAGSNCNFPLTNDNLCGPTVGLYNQQLSFTTYYGTQNFQFAGNSELSLLVSDVSAIAPFPGPNGAYLDSMGFENMSNKILIADTLLKLNADDSHEYDNYMDTMHIVPFIDTEGGVFTDCDHNQSAIFNDEPHFCYALGYVDATYVDDCAYPNYSYYKMNYTVSNTASSNWYFLKGAGYFCNDGNWEKPIAWDSPSQAPGWSYYLDNSIPQKRFLMPVRINLGSVQGCSEGFSPLNRGGMASKCGADYEAFLSINLPKPPTCSIPNVNPPCQ